MKTVAPFGAWVSPVTTDLMTAAAISLGALTVDGDILYWLEGRPSESGRSVLCRRGADGAIEELTPAPINVGSRVHEYGGGAFGVEDGVIVYSERKDGSVWIIEPGAPPRRVATPEGCRYADFEFDSARRRVLAVREDHRDRPPTNPEAAIVALPLDGDAPEIVLVKGPDFLSSPRLSPDGRNLAWIAWDHPDMPWDRTRLYCAALAGDGALEAPELIAGAEPEEAIVQPAWSAQNILHFSSDRSGWWNLYAREGGRDLPLCPIEAEIGGPHWVFRQRYYAFLKDGRIVASFVKDGVRRAALIADGRLTPLDIGQVAESPQPLGDGLAYIATPPTAPPAIHDQASARQRAPPRQGGGALRPAAGDHFDRRADRIPNLAWGRTRVLVCAEEPRFRGAGGRPAAAGGPLAWRPDQHDDQSFQPQRAMVDQPRHRRRRRQLRRLDRLWPPVPAPARRTAGGSSTSRTAAPRRIISSAAASSTAPASPFAAAAPAASRRSRR